jgi:site-specific recombinase XerD
MGNLIQDFQNYLEVERNVSPHTQKAYIADIQEFTGFLQSNSFIKKKR